MIKFCPFNSPAFSICCTNHYSSHEIIIANPFVSPTHSTAKEDLNGATLKKKQTERKCYLPPFHVSVSLSLVFHLLLPFHNLVRIGCTPRWVDSNHHSQPTSTYNSITYRLPISINLSIILPALGESWLGGLIGNLPICLTVLSPKLTVTYDLVLHNVLWYGAGLTWGFDITRISQ